MATIEVFLRLVGLPLVEFAVVENVEGMFAAVPAGQMDLSSWSRFLTSLRLGGAFGADKGEEDGRRFVEGVLGDEFPCEGFRQYALIEVV